MNIIPAILYHEGTSSELHPCVKGKLACPWHGRVFQPLAEFDLQCPNIQKTHTEFHELILEENTLNITFKDNLTLQ